MVVGEAALSRIYFDKFIRRLPTPARLLVTGGTGNVGGAALKGLLAKRPAGTALNVATREPGRDRHVLGQSAAPGVN